MKQAQNVLSPVGKILGPAASFFGPAGQVIGAISGAQSLFGNSGSSRSSAPRKPTTPGVEKPFVPTRPGAMERPGSLNPFANFTPEQERSALATQGVQRGLGGAEDQYYKNLVQRSLIGEGNQVTGDSNSLLPVESQYFSGQGVDTSNIMNFLKAIRG